jgi:sugar transferase (PEP-CTERM/EpsH1 system associated)
MYTRLHIAHVVLSLQPGGLENGVVNIVNGLDGSGFRSTVICLKRRGEFAQRIVAPAATIHEMGLKAGNDWTLPWRLARLLRREGVDIVHTRNAESFFYGCAAAKLGGIAHLVHSEHGRRFDDRPLRFHLQRLLSRGTDAIFAVSQQLKQDLCRHIGLKQEDIDVVYNGVDLARFGRGGRGIARAKLGLPESAVVVGSVGRLVSVKNYALLLRALRDPALARVHAVLIGEGPERAALEDLVRGAGMGDRVKLLGHRDDVHALLGGLDIFVLPSLSEGMSNTLLEAMACAVPPVASHVGGNGEIIVDGVSGRLFPNGDETALRDVLVELCSEEQRRDSLGDAARHRVMSAFDLEVMVRNYEALYERVASATLELRCES